MIKGAGPQMGGAEGQAEAVQGEGQFLCPGVLVTFPWHKSHLQTPVVLNPLLYLPGMLLKQAEHPCAAPLQDRDVHF